MSSKHLDGEDARKRALQRLQAAVTERGQARDASEASAETKGDVATKAALRAADDQVMARERWLKDVDDHAL